MNRLLLCLVSCILTTGNLIAAPEDQKPEQTQKEVQESKKISRENITPSITEYLARLCKQKGFSLHQIPENMSAERQTKMDHIRTLLSEIMTNNNRAFVYQQEIETLTNKTFELFLMRAHAFLLTKISHEIRKNLDTSSLARQSSKVVLPENVRTKIKQSNLFTCH